ncbi:MAG TPA: HAD hydrolase family protein [Pirellulaceae bacterium]|nr:HAD hydrolase family protein [Pirellulaceae bacterium]
MKIEQRAQPIRLILSDVDGVLTGGEIVFDNQGYESKQFHVRDGLGIKLWQRAGFHFGLLTSRSSHIVKIRAAELNISIVRQGFEDKLPMAIQVCEELGMTARETCYIGDDLPDLPVMRHVGMAVAVADAVAEVQAAAHHITRLAGGQGAVREVIETILRSQGRWPELVGQF